MQRIKYLVFVINIFSFLSLSAQGYWSKIEKLESTLGLDSGFTVFETDEFRLKLVNSSQTVAALNPLSDVGFDFTPGERLTVRDKDGLYHLGDLNLRLRKVGGSQWISISTASKRNSVEPLETKGNILAASDLRNTLPENIPLKVERYYEEIDGELVLRFSIQNTSSDSIQIGALGVPMIFNNILEGKTLTQTHAQNVFYDPYMGEDAGYLEVKKLSGQGPVLLVIPHENMSFESYRPLLDDPTPRSIVFEGFHEWMTCSKAYAENEWSEASPWNKPTYEVLAPLEKKDFSLKLVLATSIKNVEKKLREEGLPVALGVPGYVLPMDVRAQLFLQYEQPVEQFIVEPQGALMLTKESEQLEGIMKYHVQGQKWGRARLTVVYSDGKRQTINYKVIKPEQEVIEDFGCFLTTEQWFDDPNDHFGRNPSVITYDYETKEQVKQDPRAWICGLGDEGGAGGWLAAVMKQLVQPDKQEINKLERFVDETLWGGLQLAEGDQKYGVKKSLFYYQPDAMPEGTYSESVNFNTWAAWDYEHASLTERSFNYPHVAAVHWVMYRLARYYFGLVDTHSWDWYLKNAYHTAVAMVEQAPYYAQFGQMEGSVFLLILEDLKREGFADMASDLEIRMKARADHWRTLDFPFGSEMPWDSTGQEEVFTWSKYFGFDEKALITLNAILAYMPTMPHWAYNGNARRYWDFLYGGKAGPTSRVERQIHHYGSSLNAIPVLSQYRETPEDLHLLKVGYGGLLGGISNITVDGFGPAAFHSFPSTLKIDGISGDYGSGFYGYAVNSSAYLVYDNELGWLGYGANVSIKGDVVSANLTTAAKSRLYIAPLKLWVTLDAGNIQTVTFNTKTKQLSLVLGTKSSFMKKAYLRAEVAGVPVAGLKYKTVRDAYEIPLKKKEVMITFNLNKG